MSPLVWKSNPFGDNPDPGEQGRYVVEVTAPNERAAKIIAMKSDEMRGWLTEARGDDVNPFSGLVVERLEVEEET